MAKQESASPAPWSFKVLSVAGIPIRIHFTFLLLLVWIGVLAYREESRVMALLVPSVFACVVLHELGHALVAKAFGVKTRDITLYPIGGVAMLEGRPKPFQELWIALAGPAVNVVLAAVAFGLYWALYGQIPSVAQGWEGSNYLEGLYAMNVVLPIFNMIPAFPMDGGRVLRAFLALNMPEVKATRIAGSIGQLMAMVLGFYGLVSMNIMLVLIAFFVFMGAGQEVQTTIGLSLIAGRKVGEAMMTQFHTLSSGESLGAASRRLLEGSQACFPVVAGEDVVGLLKRDDIVRGLATEGPDGYVAGYMAREFPTYDADQSLESVFERASSDGGLPALVYREGRLAGILSADNLGEFLMVRQALRKDA